MSNLCPDDPGSINRKMVCCSIGLIFMVFAACTTQQREESSRANGEDLAEAEMPVKLPDQDSAAERPAGVFGEVPDFAFINLDGDTIRVSDYKGNVLVLNFWATWCLPCQREIPDLIRLREEFDGQGLEILGIALDEEGFEVVTPFLRQFDINYPVVVDDYTYGNKLGGIFMVPTTYIVDRDGKIVARKIGEVKKDDILPVLEPLL